MSIRPTLIARQICWISATAIFNPVALAADVEG